MATTFAKLIEDAVQKTLNAIKGKMQSQITAIDNRTCGNSMSDTNSASDGGTDILRAQASFKRMLDARATTKLTALRTAGTSTQNDFFFTFYATLSGSTTGSFIATCHAIEAFNSTSDTYSASYQFTASNDSGLTYRGTYSTGTTSGGSAINGTCALVELALKSSVDALNSKYVNSPTTAQLKAANAIIAYCKTSDNSTTGSCSVAPGSSTIVFGGIWNGAQWFFSQGNVSWSKTNGTLTVTTVHSDRGASVTWVIVGVMLLS